MMRRPSIQLSAWIAKQAREGGREIHNTPFEPWEGTTIVNSKTGASLDQACLAFGTSWATTGNMAALLLSLAQERPELGKRGLLTERA